MTDESPDKPTRNEDECAPSAEEDPTGDEALDARLAEPVLQGTAGIEHAQAVVGAFLIVVLAFLAFSNTLAIPFNSIEQERIAGVDALQGLTTAPEGWTESGLQPLAALSLALDWTLSGGAPWFLRGVSVAFHALNGVLVFLLARRLIGAESNQLIAAAAGAVFVLHPAVTESVNLLTNRGVLLGTTGLLLAALLFLRAVADPKQFGALSYGFALIVVALAWTAWPVVSVAPLLLTAMDAVTRKNIGIRPRVMVHAPFWLLVAALWTAYVAAGNEPGPGFLAALSPRALGDILVTSVYPHGLSLAHEAAQGYGGVFIVIALAALSAGLIRWLGTLGVALFWYTTAILAGVVAPGAALSISEAFFYVPLAGLVLGIPCAVSGIGLDRVRAIVGGAVAAVAIVFAVLTYMRNQVWQSEAELWIDARGKCPACTEPLVRLLATYVAEGEASLQAAQAAAAQGDASEAGRQQDIASSYFRRAENALVEVIQRPDVPAEVWTQLGTAQRYQGNLTAARESLRQAVRRDPTSHTATLQLALLTEAQALDSGARADLQHAAELYGRAAELGPLPDEIAVRAATIWEAIGNLQRALTLLRPLVEGGNNQATAAFARLRPDLERVSALQARKNQLEQTNPNATEVLRLAAQELYFQRQYLEASYMIESIFRSRGSDLELWSLLGVCKAKMQGFDRFLADWPEPPSGEAEVSPWYDLAMTAAQRNEWPAARSALAYENTHTDTERVVGYALAGVARSLDQPQRAVGFLQEAAEARPADPEPWLRLCEVAIELEQPDAVRQFLGEAETRGASEETLDDIRERAGVEESRPTRTMIR